MGHTEAETERLIEQAAHFALPLRRLFEDAGLTPGMRVALIALGTKVRADCRDRHAGWRLGAC
jgi:hypothetical protein